MSLHKQILDLKSKRIPKQSELKQLFQNFLVNPKYRYELHNDGTHLCPFKHGYCCDVKDNYWMWLAFIQGLQPKDIKMLLVKRYGHDLVLPVWQDILTMNTNYHKTHESTITKEEILLLDKDVHIFQRHIWLSDGVLIVMSSPQYDLNCVYQSFCFSPGKCLNPNFVNSLLICASFTKELPLPIAKCLHFHGIDTSIHITYIGGRTEGQSLLDERNGYLHKYATDQKIIISSFVCDFGNKKLLANFLNYGFKIASIIDKKCYLIRIELYSSEISNLSTLFKATISMEPMFCLDYTCKEFRTPKRYSKNARISKTMSTVKAIKLKNTVSRNIIPVLTKEQEKIPIIEKMQSLSKDDDDDEDDDASIDADDLLDESSIDDIYKSLGDLFDSSPLLHNRFLLEEDVMHGVLTPIAKDSLPFLPRIPKGKRDSENAELPEKYANKSKKISQIKTSNDTYLDSELKLSYCVSNILLSTTDNVKKLEDLLSLCDSPENFFSVVGSIHQWTIEHPNFEIVTGFVKNILKRDTSEDFFKQIFKCKNRNITYFMEICSYLYERSKLKDIFNNTSLSISKLIMSEIIIFRSNQLWNDSLRFGQEYLNMKNNCKEELHVFLMNLLSEQFKITTNSEQSYNLEYSDSSAEIPV